jgi:hypothetical protein
LIVLQYNEAPLALAKVIAWVTSEQTSFTVFVGQLGVITEHPMRFTV